MPRPSERPVARKAIQETVGIIKTLLGLCIVHHPASHHRRPCLCSSMHRCMTKVWPSVIWKTLVAVLKRGATFVERLGVRLGFGSLRRQIHPAMAGQRSIVDLTSTSSIFQSIDNTT